eukprot:scaffold15144_cov39-Tisochrysis_lutea.AAC.1
MVLPHAMRLVLQNTHYTYATPFALRSLIVFGFGGVVGPRALPTTSEQAARRKGQGTGWGSTCAGVSYRGKQQTHENDRTIVRSLELMLPLPCPRAPAGRSLRSSFFVFFPTTAAFLRRLSVIGRVGRARCRVLVEPCLMGSTYRAGREGCRDGGWSQLEDRP